MILYPRAELRGWSAVIPGGENLLTTPIAWLWGVCINQETIQAKFQLSTIPQLGCRWGRSVLGGASFSKLGTSVDVLKTNQRVAFLIFRSCFGKVGESGDEVRGKGVILGRERGST